MSEDQEPRSVSEVLFRELYREVGEILDRAEAMKEAMNSAETSLQNTAQRVAQGAVQNSQALLSSLSRPTVELQRIADQIRENCETMHTLNRRISWIAVVLGGLFLGALAGLVIGMIWR